MTLDMKMLGKATRRKPRKSELQVWGGKALWIYSCAGIDYFTAVASQNYKYQPVAEEFNNWDSAMQAHLDVEDWRYKEALEIEVGTHLLKWPVWLSSRDKKAGDFDFFYGDRVWRLDREEYDQLNMQDMYAAQRGENERKNMHSMTLLADAELLAAEDKMARKVQQARSLVSQSAATVDPSAAGFQRQAIPRDAKMFVWQRDGGVCVYCGDNRDLEFDHIIPVSMGGANTARNLQLLCEPCNRSKGGNL